jgi:gliding motility-associated-like protein
MLPGIYPGPRREHSVQPKNPQAMSRIAVLLLLLWFPPAASVWAQGEENLWFFGEAHVVDFSGGTPAVAANPPRSQQGRAFPGYYPDWFGLQAAVCDPAGNLRFFVHVRSNASIATQYRKDPKIFDATGYSMPHGDINAAETSGSGTAESPMIVPWPGEPDKYFVFYTIDAGLLYSVVDMRLNNGMGDVDTMEKDILLRGFGTIIGAKYAAVQACDGVWVVVRSRVTNEYYSFHITREGLDRNPVVSSCGLLPSLTDYEHPSYRGGRLAASPDGRTLAAACTRGIELYDFEACSGRVSNPRLIDTLNFLGVCFSPNNRVLYATSWEYPSRHPGRVYQYDLGQFNAPAITASRVLVLENPRVACRSFQCGCGSCNCDTLATYLGDLKRGPDGKIYMANNYRSCHGGDLPAPPTAPMPFPPATGVFDSSALHVIHEPNRLGWACNPQLHAVTIKKGVFASTTGMWFSRPVVVVPPVPDTAKGEHIVVAACFRDSLFLSANTPGRCYQWDDGTTQRERVVYAPGLYTVAYFDNDCHYHKDSFTVVFTLAPHPGVTSYSCPNGKEGRLEIRPLSDDTTAFRYDWYDEGGTLLRSHSGDTGDSQGDLPPGNYTVKVSTALGCDTSFQLEVLPLPRPEALFEVDTIVCKGAPVVFVNRSVEPLWQWYPGDGTSYNKGREITHYYKDTGIYRAALVVKNMEGCTDTAIQRLSVRDFFVSLEANPAIASRRERVVLSSHANESYRILAWYPSIQFAHQEAYRQELILDSSSIYTVVAESAYGCIDSASVQVMVHPIVMVPTAFTPNGDGQNDFFRPVIAGGTGTLLLFVVYDRWGRKVWSAEGTGKEIGWDGTYQGLPAELGVYHYLMELETFAGQIVRKKGEVTLVR